MTQELLDKIEKEMNPLPEMNFRGIPAKDSDIAEAEEKLKVKFHEDYIVFIKTFGGAYAGIAVHAFENNEMLSKDTVVDLTETFREDYAEDPRSAIINTGYVISMDGSGNPIVVDASGQVMIFYHDCDEYKIFAPSFSEFIEGAISNKFENEW